MATRTIAGIVALLMLQGCSSTPRFEKSFGNAVRTNITAQTIDPHGATNTNPARGIDGPAARAAHERYQHSFVRPESASSAPLLNTLGSGQ